MKSTHLIGLLLVFAFSCTEQNKTKSLSIVPKTIQAKGRLISNDSIEQPQIIKVGKPKVVTVVMPKSLAVKTNIYLAGTPKTVNIDFTKLQSIIPGTGTFKLPEVIMAIDSSFIAKEPKPISASAPRMKDELTCNIQYLDVDQGMNSSYVFSALEDRFGNLWFGTYRGGVAKYDGKSFAHYTDKEGLSSNSVFSMIEDRSGNIWFGNTSGASKYDGNHFTQYNNKKGFTDKTIWAIYEDKSGNIWFGTFGDGVIKYNGKSFTHYTDKQGLSNNSVFSIHEDKSGNMWFGTFGGGISKYDGKSFTNYTEKDGLCNNSVLAICEDNFGNIWIGTDDGVSKYDGKSFLNYTTKEGMSNNSVMSIIKDRTGNLWFGTNGGGVFKYDGRFFRHYNDRDGMSSNYVRCILEDKFGNLWFGTDDGGVSKLDPKSFIHFARKEGLGNSSAKAIYEDRSGNIWFATDGDGITKFDGKYFTFYTEKDGLCSNSVLAILEDRSGNLWFGSNGGGVSKYNGKTFVNYTKAEGLSSNFILSIIEDKSGNIWFGTTGGGAIKYDGYFFKNYTYKSGISNSTVWSILEDRSGNFWFATNGGGVTKYDGNSFTNYTDKEGLGGNYVFSIHEDKTGNLWFGTVGGMSKYDGKTFINYTEREGLSHNSVFSIVEDKLGDLWLGTGKGISYFISQGFTKDKEDLFAEKLHKNKEIGNPKIIVFHKEDGLKAEDFFQNSVLLDSKNQLWWGSGKTVSMLDRNKFHLNETEPDIHLESIYLQDNFIDYQNIKTNIKRDPQAQDFLSEIKFNGVAEFYNYPKKLELPYNLNHLTFYFSAIDWSAPHKIKYQYQLVGLEPGWSELTPHNKADYRNIPYGKYIFKVKAINAFQKWSKTLDYSFVIHPPWWHTKWAYSAYGFCGLGCLIGTIRFNNRRLRSRAKELKLKVDEATLEIIQQKHLIEEKHKEITDSINYAERIQRSFLATKELLDENLNDYFVLFKPKDVVSGDFYWASKLNNGNFALATADSTGHGVPGAIMSLLNITSLEKAIETVTEPSNILNATRKTIIERLKKDGSEQGGKDGMDASLTVYDFKNNKLIIAAANNPVWIVRGAEVIDIKPDKMPIGKGERDAVLFTQQEIDLQKGDVVYTLTDGFPDQFGGEKGKKFMSKNLRELLANNSLLPMNEQKQLLEKTFADWAGNLEQVDDVTIIGVRI